MAVLPGLTSRSSTPEAADTPAPAQLAEAVLLIGPSGHSLRSTLQHAIATLSQGNAPPTQFALVDTVLEAILLPVDRASPSLEAASPSPRSTLIVVDATNELSELEAAVRSLRRTHPDAAILLVCDPSDEVLCRKARNWGANDYFLLPLTATDAARIVTYGAPVAEVSTNGHSPLRADHALSALKSARDALRSTPTPRSANDDPGLPSLPLIVQTELLEDLIACRPDFIDRALATLSQHLPIDGKLRFIPGNDPPAPPVSADPNDPQREIRRIVTLGDQPAFGTLILDTQTVTPATTAAVAQAAHWLAGMLAISRRHDQLRSLAITDELSGAYNRRYFMQYTAALLKRAKDNRTRVTLLLFDIDDFKRYNDTFGHGSGDAIIRELIKLMQTCTREGDLVARIGGDEFAVVYGDNEAPRQPNSEHPRDVIAATHRFREAVKNHQWPQACNIKGQVSISGGLATFPWDADSVDALMRKADEALLRAKAAGKNVIVMTCENTTPATTESL